MISLYHFQNDWNFDLEYKHGELKTAFQAQKVTMTFRETGPRAGFLKLNAHLFNLKLSKKRARKRFAFESKYLTVCIEGSRWMNNWKLINIFKFMATWTE